MTLRVVPVLLVVLATCAAPTQYGGAIAIDQEGVADRLRRVCELGKASAGGGSCVSVEGDASETDDAEDLAEPGEPRDADLAEAGEPRVAELQSADAGPMDRD
jgi:hypothetical protein